MVGYGVAPERSCSEQRERVRVLTISLGEESFGKENSNDESESSDSPDDLDGGYRAVRGREREQGLVRS